MERLRPIFALYGQPGLNLLRQLQEIDARCADTAQITTADGQTAYAGYFFTRPEVDFQAAREAAKDYIRAVNRIFEEELEESQRLDEDAAIEFPTGGEAAVIEEELRQAWIHGADIPELDVREGLGDWFMELEYEESPGGAGRIAVRASLPHQQRLFPLLLPPVASVKRRAGRKSLSAPLPPVVHGPFRPIPGQGPRGSAAVNNQ